MCESLIFSEAERALLVELLEEEARELPAEIHHTRTAEVKEQLRERLALVRKLLDQLQGVAVG